MSASRAVTLRVIGKVRTPFKQPSGTPIQPLYSKGALGEVLLEEEFVPALDDIEGFERLWLVYWLDRASPYRPKVVPYRDTREHGVLATRSPCRPNPIGMSAVRLLAREGAMLRLADVDLLDETPLLDIKPYVPQFDAHPVSRAGWFDQSLDDRHVADGRFHSA